MKKGFLLEINIGTENAPRWQEVVLADGQSVTVEVNSQMFGDASSFSYGFTVPFAPNKHLFGTSDEMFGPSIYSVLYKKQARWWVGGVLFFSGRVDMDDEIDVESDGVEINIISGRKTFSDMLDGVNAQDVDIFFGDMREGRRKDGTQIEDGEKDNITLLKERSPGHSFDGPQADIRNVYIGLANSKVATASATVRLKVGRFEEIPGHSNYDIPQIWKDVDRKSFPFYMPLHAYAQDKVSVPIEFPQILGPGGWAGPNGEGSVNVAFPYKPGKDRYEHPFCNIALCAQKMEREGDSWEKRRGYTDVDLSAERYNSSPCFFVLFWLEQLFDIYLGLSYDISPIASSGLTGTDLRSLCFVNTKCQFKTLGDTASERYEAFSKFGILPDGISPITSTGASKFKATVEVQTKGRFVGSDGIEYGFMREGTGAEFCMSPQLQFDTKNGAGFQVSSVPLEYAYATSENFPDVDASEIISSLENAFGFKFVYDDASAHVSIVFYKDMLSNPYAKTLNCVVSDVRKKEVRKTGFRLKYSASKAAERNAFTRDEELVAGSDETAFNYNDYRTVSMIQGSGGRDYVSLIRDLGAYDETLYVSAITGNAFRVKVDKDAKSESKWYPSLFEVGGYRDVEYGCCEDDGPFQASVDEKVISFSPVMVNDVNYENEKACDTDAEAKQAARPAYKLFVDKDIHPVDEFDVVPIGKYMTPVWAASVMRTVFDKGFNKTQFNSIFSRDAVDRYFSGGGFSDPLVLPARDDGYDLSCQYAFNFPQGKDSNDAHCNPFNSDSSGFVLGFLRTAQTGGGSTGIRYYGENYDDEGHAKVEWVSTAASGSITSDSVDVFGQKLGGISLKLKAEKPMRGSNGRTPDEKPYDTQGNVDYEQGNPVYYPVSQTCANRGLFDVYWSDYAWFITHCKTAVLTIPPGGISLVELKSIDMAQRYTYGEYTGFINKYSCAIDDGELGEVTIELLYI